MVQVIYMRDLIAIAIYAFLGVLIFTVFVNFLPFLLPLLIILGIYNAYRRQKRMEEIRRNFEQNTYEQNYEQTSSYQTRGNIKDDVIDVEYKETVEK